VALYQGRLEQRARRWFHDEARTGWARLLRVTLVLVPLVVAWVVGVPICPAAAVARVPCPGCGLTRAAWALVTGDVGAATALNPIALLICPLLGGAAIYAALRYVATGSVAPDRWRADIILLASVALLTLVWAVRWFGVFGGPVAV
jgi:hypothetical protein